tara:strand:- start:29033 stop:29197 length:165 start_codon:yes stop_codon:yes gene_type:complete
MTIVNTAINVSRDFQTGEPVFGGLEFDTLIPFEFDGSMLPESPGECDTETDLSY